MNIPLKSIGTSLDLPAIGMGTWSMDGITSEENSDSPLEIIATCRALDAGIQSFGVSGIMAESAVAASLHNVKREEVFIMAKISLDYSHYYDTINAVVYSIKRLKCKYIDMAFLSFQNQNLSYQKVMKAIDKLMDKGKIKHLGVVNCSEDTISEINFHSKYRVRANLLRYNMLSRGVEKSGLVNFCLEHGIYVVTTNPITQNILNIQEDPVLVSIAKKYNKTPVQIALAWLNFHPHVTMLLPMQRADAIAEDLGALDFTLLGQDFEELCRTYG